MKKIILIAIFAFVLSIVGLSKNAQACYDNGSKGKPKLSSDFGMEQVKTKPKKKKSGDGPGKGGDE